MLWIFSLGVVGCGAFVGHLITVKDFVAAGAFIGLGLQFLIAVFVEYTRPED